MNNSLDLSLPWVQLSMQSINYLTIAFIVSLVLSSNKNFEFSGVFPFCLAISLFYGLLFFAYIMRKSTRFEEHTGAGWLGKNRAVALNKYYELTQEYSLAGDVESCIHRYLTEISAVERAEETHKSNIKASKYLIAAFGDMRPIDITRRHIYQYMDERSKTAPIRCNREISLLGAVMKKCVRWGFLDANPVTEIERNPEKPRNVGVTDEQVKGFLTVAPEWLQHYVVLKYITGLRQTDMLNLHSTKIREDGIYVVTSKSGGSKRLHFKMNEVMAEVLDIIDSGASQALKTNIKTMGYYLFRTRKNKKYTGDGFRSNWHTYMNIAMDKGLITAKFQERDLRSKTASESENLESARRLLGHSSEAVTRKHYHHEFETVEPLNKKLKK